MNEIKTEIIETKRSIAKIEDRIDKIPWTGQDIENFGTKTELRDEKKKLNERLDFLFNQTAVSILSKRPRLDPTQLPYYPLLLKLKESISKVTYNVDDLSDPSRLFQLPFPFPNFIPNRFSTFQKIFFTYFGRHDFKQLYEHAVNLHSSRHRKLFVYGTIGYGKSHLLAALVYLLIQIGKRVVYIPQCGELISKPVDYFKLALMLAFIDDHEKMLEISTLDSLDGIFRFFTPFSDIYLVLDQYNEFEIIGTNIELGETGEIKRWIDQIAGRCLTIISASANNYSIRLTQHKEPLHDSLFLFGGLKHDEMEFWWKRTNIEFEEAEKQFIEDQTGCVPFLLNEFLNDVQRQLIIAEVDVQINKFIIERCTENPAVENSIANFFKDVIKGEPLRTEILDKNVDHRFFYRDKKTWRYFTICGMARSTITQYLLKKNSKQFLGDEWWDCSSRFKNNRSILGFIVEYICLSSITTHGIVIPYHDKSQLTVPKLEIEFFYNFPVLKVSNQSILYIPAQYNYRAIDCFAFFTINNKHFLVPIQITIAKSHTDSEASFFRGSYQLISEPLRSNLNVHFLWVSDQKPVSFDKEPSFRRLRTSVKEINPEYSVTWVTFDSVDKKLVPFLE